MSLCLCPKLKLVVVLPLQLGGSGVLVQPMTYIFDEEPKRWTDLLSSLGVTHQDVFPL